MSSRRVSRSLWSSHRVDAERSASTLRFRGDARLVALAAAALGVLASCGDDSSGVSIDSGTVTRLDGELPDVPRPSLDA
ncbi:MAG: hypothetical protein IT379_00780, partial [Deltaproteobacteria bacterium]|nr:hypothetical protein [Deltaproteobacteria bacterium]